MANKNYEQGRYYEYLERDYWREKGYYAERQFGSYGPFDVYAIKNDGTEVVFISVKSYRTRRGDYRNDIRRLRKLPKGPGVRTIHTEYGPITKGKKTPRKERLIT